MRMDIRLHFIGLLFFLFEPVTFADLEVSVEGYEGRDVVLPCTYNGSDDSELSNQKITFDWRFKDSRNIVYMVFEGETKFDKQNKQFENRATLLAPKKGDFSVKLTNLNKNDSGKYTCTLPLLPVETDFHKQHVVLTIKEDPTTAVPRKNSGNSSMTMGPQKTLFSLILVLMILCV